VSGDHHGTSVIQDPNIKPPGYQPPTSAEDLLERHAAGERYFVGAELKGADLAEADLSTANLSGSCLVEALLDRTKLHRVDLSGADLGGASFRYADLQDALILGETPAEADFLHANLQGVILGKPGDHVVQLVGSSLVDGKMEERLRELIGTVPGRVCPSVDIGGGTSDMAILPRQDPVARQ